MSVFQCLRCHLLIAAPSPVLFCDPCSKVIAEPSAAIEALREAAENPAECAAGCACLCHDSDIEDPGPHLATCAWADHEFPEYVHDAASPPIGGDT